VEELDAESRTRERGDDVAQPVPRPVVLGVDAEPGLVAPVRRGVEVRPDRLQPLVEHVDDRVGLEQVEDAVVGQRPDDRVGPVLEAGQPAEDAPGGVDDVERAIERVGDGVDVTLDERGVEAVLVGEVSGVPEALPGDVDPGGVGTLADPRESLEPVVALEMQ